MNILHIGEKIYGGGAENVFYQTLSGFKRYGDPQINHYYAFKAHPKVEIVPNLDFQRVQSTLFTQLSSIYSFYNARILKSYLRRLKPDIIHIQLIGNLSPAILSAIYRYKKRYKYIKVVQTVHSFEHLCSHHAAYDYKQERRCLDCMKDQYKTKIFYRFCSRTGMLHSLAKGCVSLMGDYYFNRGLIDAYLTPSQFLASLLIERYEKDTYVRVVKNPILTWKVQKAKRENIITYFGRLSQEKNLELFIRAIPHIVGKIDIKVRVIGEGPDKERLVSLAKSEGIIDICEFIPFVPQAKLFPLLADSKVFVLTSKFYETFSLVLYESIMAGLVPVVPAHGPLKEGVTWLRCGLLYESENYLDLAEKVIKAVKEYESYASSLNAAKEKINHELNLEKYISDLSSIYREVITDKN